MKTTFVLRYSQDTTAFALQRIGEKECKIFVPIYCQYNRIPNIILAKTFLDSSMNIYYYFLHQDKIIYKRKLLVMFRMRCDRINNKCHKFNKIAH